MDLKATSSLKLALIVGPALAIVAVILTEMGSATPPFTPPNSTTALIPPWSAFKIGCKLHEFFSFMAFATQPPDAYVLNMSSAYWKSEVAYALAYHKVFDALEAENSASCEKLAEGLELQAFVLCKYMDAGKNFHLLAQDKSTKEFSLTPHGKLLTVDGGQRDFLLFVNRSAKNAWRAAGTQLMKEGGGETKKGGWDMYYGEPVWEYISKVPEEEAEFGRAMAAFSHGPSGAVISDWKPPSDDALVCDIGGGMGLLLGEIMLHYPNMKGIVFDRPEVAERAAEHFASLGLTARASTLGGSFFEELPEELAECDAYIMRHILHDWGDEESVKILENIRVIGSKTEKKKVVVSVDHILDTGAPAFLEAAKSMMSINMISSCSYGAKERTIPEHIELFREAGYSKLELNGRTETKFVPMRSIVSALQVEI